MNLGSLIAVPSPLDGNPDGESYFSGGNTTRAFGSKVGGEINVIQPRGSTLRGVLSRMHNTTWPKLLSNFFQLNYEM